MTIEIEFPELTELEIEDLKLITKTIALAIYKARAGGWIQGFDKCAAADKQNPQPSIEILGQYVTEPEDVK